jgi:hypothetical protein
MSPEPQPSTSNGSVNFTNVQQAELDAIQTAFPGVTEKELVGLAFSGGGIRSATFGLGVLEGLKKLGLLNQVHYLSTVSGGGYIGGWFSANCRRARDRRDAYDWRSSEADWSRSIQYLRDYSNYLSPDVGFFSADTWSMFTIWARNAMLVQWTIAITVACVLLVPRLAAYVFSIWPTAGHFRWFSVGLFIVGVAGIAGNLQQVSNAKKDGWRKWLLRKERARAGLALAAVFGAAVWATGFDPFGPPPIDPWMSLFVAGLLVMGGYCLLPTALAVYDWRAKATYTEVNYGQAHVQWFIVVPLLVCSFLFGAILWDLSETVLATMTYGQLFLGAWRHWPFPLSVVFISLWGLAFCSIEQWKVKGPAVALIAAVGSVVTLHALLCAIVLLLQPWSSQSMSHAFVMAPVMVLYAFSLTIIVVIGLVGRQSLESVREWWSRLGAWLIIYGAAWVIVTVAAVYGPPLVYLAFTKHFWVSLSSAAGWAGTILAGLAAGHSDRTGRDETAKARNPLHEFVAFVAPFLFIVGLLIGVATLLDLIIQVNTNGKTWTEMGMDPDKGTIALVSLAVLGVCAGLVMLLGWRTDINVFSLNAFYRNRLVRAYLGATRLGNKHSPPADPTALRNPQNFTGFDEQDDLPLADLNGADKRLAGPLHIVNCALNLGGSRDLALHTRHSASFTLSPLYAGSDYEHCDASGATAKVGYVETARYGGRRQETTLGKAISVSGAAASPNMGYHTSPVVAFLLTVFNLRLGWWFANPAQNYARKAPHFNLRYMILELFGSATGRSKFLMVSDGGHFENLAVYELVKRRCKVIIASDAECDPTLSFEGLGSLIRMCQVDFGFEIKIDVGSLRPRAGSPWSEQRCAVGTIDYGDDTGYLVYLKSAMTGHEPTAVLQYKARHSHFPHETTGDQFYAEDQFESYRRLGAEVTGSAFEAAIHAVGSKDMVALAKTLAQTNAPTLEHLDHFTRHTQSLIGLWNKLQKSEDLRPLDRGVFGAAVDGATADGARLRLYTCAEMLQLMENVYIDLHLDDTWDHADNSGWRALFTQWAALDEVQHTWRETSHLFGVRFGFFCERNLDLPRANGAVSHGESAAVT